MDFFGDGSDLPPDLPHDAGDLFDPLHPHDVSDPFHHNPLDLFVNPHEMDARGPVYDAMFLQEEEERRRREAEALFSNGQRETAANMGFTEPPLYGSGPFAHASETSLFPESVFPQTPGWESAPSTESIFPNTPEPAASAPPKEPDGPKTLEEYDAHRDRLEAQERQRIKREIDATYKQDALAAKAHEAAIERQADTMWEAEQTLSRMKHEGSFLKDDPGLVNPLAKQPQPASHTPLNQATHSQPAPHASAPAIDLPPTAIVAAEEGWLSKIPHKGKWAAGAAALAAIGGGWAYYVHHRKQNPEPAQTQDQSTGR